MPRSWDVGVIMLLVPRPPLARTRLLQRRPARNVRLRWRGVHYRQPHASSPPDDATDSSIRLSTYVGIAVPHERGSPAQALSEFALDRAYSASSTAYSASSSASKAKSMAS